jgi:hypothetical protein
MSQACRPRAVEEVLAQGLRAAAARKGATLDVGPWRPVGALPMVSALRGVGGGSGATRREARRAKAREAKQRAGIASGIASGIAKRAKAAAAMAAQPDG